jgi:hypothetical protein
MFVARRMPAITRPPGLFWRTSAKDDRQIAKQLDAQGLRA